MIVLYLYVSRETKNTILSPQRMLFRHPGKVVRKPRETSPKISTTAQRRAPIRTPGNPRTHLRRSRQLMVALSAELFAEKCVQRICICSGQLELGAFAFDVAFVAAH
jgi:hypothetical protein